LPADAMRSLTTASAACMQPSGSEPLAALGIRPTPRPAGSGTPYTPTRTSASGTIVALGSWVWWGSALVRDLTRRKQLDRWQVEKKWWERFVVWRFRGGTSLATIPKSFGTMVPWRKTSLRLSATTG